MKKYFIERHRQELLGIILIIVLSISFILYLNSSPYWLTVLIMAFVFVGIINDFLCFFINKDDFILTVLLIAIGVGLYTFI